MMEGGVKVYLHSDTTKSLQGWIGGETVSASNKMDRILSLEGRARPVFLPRFPTVLGCHTV